MKTELSARQQEIANLVKLALSDKAIATKLGISEETVGFHLRAIYQKLNIRSRVQLAVILHAGEKNEKPQIRYCNKKRETNYFIAYRLRIRINQALKGIRKAAPSIKLLGCSINQFRLHISSQFQLGMTWENYGKGWHLDHIEPCASFDLSNLEEQRRCFHFSNIRPLWAAENLLKHDKIIPTQRELLITFEQSNL